MNDSSHGDSGSIPLGGILFVGGFVGAIAVLFFQVFVFLQYGHWLPISVVTGLRWLGVEWASNPTTWLGVHKVFDFLPLSVFSVLVAVISGWIWQNSGNE
jgi:hypothetical protein